MTVTVRKSRPEDLPHTLQLLRVVELPTDRVKEHFISFLIAIASHEGPQFSSVPIIGCVGLELYGSSALLRSLAIHPDFQNQRLGTRLLDAMIKQAITQNIQNLYLLTDSAVGFFQKFGFRLIDREQVVEDVKQSIEFTTLCTTASAMVKNL